LDVTFGGTNTGFIDIGLGTLAGSFTGVTIDGADQALAFGDTDSSITDTPALGIVSADGILVANVGQNVCSCSDSGTFATGVVGASGRVFAVDVGHDKSA